MDIWLLLKIWVKILLKIQVKTYVLNTVKNFFTTQSNLQQIHLKPPQKEQFRETAESTGNFVGKIADRITKVSRNSPQNNPETSTNEYDK